MRKIAMFAWIFDECREGRCPLGAKTPLLCSAASLIPRCLQRGFWLGKRFCQLVVGESLESVIWWRQGCPCIRHLFVPELPMHPSFVRTGLHGHPSFGDTEAAQHSSSGSAKATHVMVIRWRQGRMGICHSAASGLLCSSLLRLFSISKSRVLFSSGQDSYTSI